MPLDSRAKGARYELEVELAFREIFGREEVCRGYQRIYGSHPPDIITPLWNCECKIGNRWEPYAALLQVHKDCEKKSLPVVVARKNHKDSIAFMDFDLLLALTRQLQRFLAGATPNEREAFWEDIVETVKWIKEKKGNASPRLRNGIHGHGRNGDGNGGQTEDEAGRGTGDQGEPEPARDEVDQ